NTSVLPIEQADSSMLYDFRMLSDIIHNPGPTRQVSARTIQGFNQYILSLYQKRNYAGIYVYVPKRVMVGTNQLADDILVIEVLEAPITDVTVRIYDADQNEKEKGYLRKSALMGWSPVKEGQVANQKELDDFVNLLNRNPDRYVSATVTKGATDNSLAVQYDVYEANPWHYFVQIDNSGTRDRRWTPRVGVVNTNLLGYDDTFAAVFQAPWDKTFDENYSVFGTYDFPIAGPKLRLQMYAGYAEFNVNPDSGPFKFLGNGNFFGGILRYNAYQTEENMPLLGGGWFIDVKAMLEYTRSKVSPQLPGIPLATSDVRFWMWGLGLELHKKTDLTSTTIGFDRWESSGLDRSNTAAFTGSRLGTDPEFVIYDFSARHSEYIDTNKVHRVSGSGRWVVPDKRIVPAKMTSFGGMYTVRGYDEYEIVADGGILASLQYEYDLIAADKAKNPPQDAEQAKQHEKENPFFIKRAAPLAFLDFGRTTINAPRNVGESKHDELCSVGIGMLLDIGNNFSGAVYYGHPLIATPDTREGKGRLNCSFMMRW
ncbi:MAG: ShlB/FhaC/HecB family hemolysin secretion/activation protein, partial [Phycisphaerae bacterium]